MSTESGRAALDMSGVDLSEIDALVLATTTPDTQWGTAATVQNDLGLRCGAFDVNAACSGFVYGLVTAHGLIAMGARKVLLIGTDSLSRIVDWEDRNTAVLFGDGSGAVVLEAVEGPRPAAGMGSRCRRFARSAAVGRGRRLHPHGRQRGLPARRAHHGRLGHQVAGSRRFHGRRHLAGHSASGQRPHHQGGVRAAGHRPDRSAVTVLDETGNTSSASVPLALADALDNGRVKEGDLLLLVGFGGGMTAASAVLRWGGGAPAGEPA